MIEIQTQRQRHQIPHTCPRGVLLNYIIQRPIFLSQKYRIEITTDNFMLATKPPLLNYQETYLNELWEEYEPQRIFAPKRIQTVTLQYRKDNSIWNACNYTHTPFAVAKDYFNHLSEYTKPSLLCLHEEHWYTIDFANTKQHLSIFSYEFWSEYVTLEKDFIDVLF